MGTAQAKLAELDQIYGTKEGQAKRGPQVHHTAAYPNSLLGGLLFCGECGARMWLQRSGPRTYLGCPNAGNAAGMCTMLTTVPVEKAEKTLLDFVSELLVGYPDWMQRAVAAMRAAIAEVAAGVPPELAAAQKRLAELGKSIDNLVDSIASGRDSEAVQSRLARDELERDSCRKKIAEMERLLAAPVQIPSDNWIAQRFRGLPDLLRGDIGGTALLLRKLLGKVEVHPVIPTGKSRGWPQLRFCICASAACDVVLQGQMPSGTLSLLANAAGPMATGHSFDLDVGGPSRMDMWGPRIVEMRAEGMQWKEIWEITGLGSGPAYVAWKRCVEQTSVGDVAHGSPDETDVA